MCMSFDDYIKEMLDRSPLTVRGAKGNHLKLHTYMLHRYCQHHNAGTRRTQNQVLFSCIFPILLFVTVRIMLPT